MKALVECLWYIDGRHLVIQQQSCPIPSVFSKFQQYNVPEKSKHSIGNESRSTLCNPQFSLLSTSIFVLAAEYKMESFITRYPFYLKALHSIL